MRPSVPLVLLTADPRGKEAATQLGADAYVAKPFDLGDLLEKMEQFV